MVACVVTSRKSLPISGETGSGSGLQIRHRRFDSDRSLFLLCRDGFDLLESKVLIERWREASSTDRPHSSPGYQTPASRRPWPLALAVPQQTRRRSKTREGREKKPPERFAAAGGRARRPDRNGCSSCICPELRGYGAANPTRIPSGFCCLEEAS